MTLALTGFVAWSVSVSRAMASPTSDFPEINGSQARPPQQPLPGVPAIDDSADGAETERPDTRVVKCDCDSVFTSTEFEVPWRSEVESMLVAAVELQGAFDSVARQSDEWAELWDEASEFDKRIGDLVRRGNSEVVDEAARRRNQVRLRLESEWRAIWSGVGEIQRDLPILASRLEAPHSAIPEPFREAMQQSAVRDRAILRSSVGAGMGVVGRLSPVEDVEDLDEALLRMKVLRSDVSRAVAVIGRLVRELNAVSVEGAELWGWTQVIGTERIPRTSGDGNARNVAIGDRYAELDSMLRYTCAMEAFVQQVPTWFKKTGPRDPWMSLVESALPSSVSSTRRGFPNLRTTFLDRLVDEDGLRSGTQVRTIQENARKRVGRWLEGEMQRYGAIDDPALSARWTCLREFAGLLQEGKPLPKAPAKAPQKEVAP